MSNELIYDVKVTIGEGVAVLQRSGRSDPIVAGLIDVTYDCEGEPVELVLDRLIHRSHEQWRGWRLEGPYVTVMSRHSGGPALTCPGGN